MPEPLHRTVRSLGLVSLLTDASSEMIYPLLPAFLTGTLRAGPAFLGVVEGLAETVAAALKIVSGRVSDRLPRSSSPPPCSSRTTCASSSPSPRSPRSGRCTTS